MYMHFRMYKRERERGKSDGCGGSTTPSSETVPERYEVTMSLFGLRQSWGEDAFGRGAAMKNVAGWVPVGVVFAGLHLMDTRPRAAL
jgi:hypothetical protein